IISRSCTIRIAASLTQFQEVPLLHIPVVWTVGLTHGRAFVHQSLCPPRFEPALVRFDSALRHDGARHHMVAWALAQHAEDDKDVVVVIGVEFLALRVQYPDLAAQLIRLALDRYRPGASLVGRQDVDTPRVTQGDGGNVAE